MMKITLPLGTLTKTTFIDRPNRFIVRCQLQEHDKAEIVTAHLADPGRLLELLIPGCPIWLRKADNPNRKTQWSAILVADQDGTYVSLDSNLPNKLVESALKQYAITEIKDFEFVRREFPLKKHRFDFLLAKGEEKMLLEVKSVTLAENGKGMFPDAVTKRGRDHVLTLAEIAQTAGMHSTLLFIAQRADIEYITAAAHIDPKFAAALEKAQAAGVNVLGYRCLLTAESITLEKGIPVI